MARWCPQCGDEYMEGWATCTTCGADLVDEPVRPARRRRSREFTEEDAIFTEPKAARDHDDPFVAIWEGPTTEATSLARRLEQSHVPVDLDEADEPGRSRLEVPRSYITEAYGLVDSSEGMMDIPEPDLDELDLPEPFESTGWSPAMRITLVVVAALVIVGLILAY